MFSCLRKCFRTLISRKMRLAYSVPWEKTLQIFFMATRSSETLSCAELHAVSYLNTKTYTTTPYAPHPITLSILNVLGMMNLVPFLITVM